MSKLAKSLKAQASKNHFIKMIQKNWLTPTESSLFFTKNDPLDPRLGDLINKNAEPKNTTLSPDALVLIGYPDDEGISLNGGRPGAQSAPHEIRKFFYKLTPHLQRTESPGSEANLNDLGNLKTVGIDLQERHRRAREIVRIINENKTRWISLGGGHDYGYSDACGFLDVHKNQALIINVDSHLDVRPFHGLGHSGTPFYRMLEEFSNSVHFFELGIQNHCNSRAHLDWARAHGAHIVFQENLKSARDLSALKKQLLPYKQHKVFLSLDIDGFSSQVAPGCSQSWATGLPLDFFIKFLEFLKQEFDVRGLGIYEVSPPLYQYQRTSKLAALLMHKFLYGE